MNGNILITGKPGTGKSTLALWLIEHLGQPWAGYQTVKAEDTPAGPLYVMKQVPGGACAPISRQAAGGIRGIPETFEVLGTQWVQAAVDGPCPVIVLDEIGRFEGQCEGFLAAIHGALDSPKLVIAVLKKEEHPHLRQLREREDSFLFDLDELSRLDARERLLSLLRAETGWGGSPAQAGPF